jgi:signal peptidase I
MEKKPFNFKLVLKILGNTVFYGVIVLLVMFSIANMQVKREDNIANVFGIGFLSVQSDSMVGEGEDNFSKGDLIFVKMLDNQSRSELQVGNVVTFFDRNIKQFNTHRIVEIFVLEQNTYLVTRGDNTNGDEQPILASEALSVYQSSSAGLGNTLDYLQTPTGFALFVILPVLFVLIFEGIVLSRNVLALNRAKIEEKFSLEKEKAQLDLEAEKEKMRQQILAELTAKQANNK